MAINKKETLETWLDVLTEQDIKEFLVKELNFKTDDNLTVGGFYTETIGKNVYPYIMVSGNKVHNTFVRENFGEFGPYLASEHQTYYYKRTFNTLLLSYDINDTEMYYKWIKFVEKKNKGRKINGLTYNEDITARLACFVQHEKNYYNSMLNKLNSGAKNIATSLNLTTNNDDSEPRQ